MPLFASIDIGSNTLRLLIGNIININTNRIGHVFSDRKITRLADGIKETGRLKEENIERSIAVLSEFSSITSKHKVKRVKAVATSALREASNSDIFLKRAYTETDISIEIISGEKEAELILKGVFSSLVPPPSSLIIDIGGGSTEWILCKGKHLINMGSVPIGVIKLNRNLIKSDPVSEPDIAELDREITSFLDGLKNKIGQHIDKHTCFIGTAGTFTTLASIDLGLETYSRERIHLHRISSGRLQDIRKKLLSLTLRERKNIKGLEPQRADLIIPGIQFTINTMEYFNFNELIVSDYGLLEGVLLDILSPNYS
jgi:exopolyphosphatase/guanosine-5'-triphosphate,3'-diphosphate pyrophosphatase